MSKKPTFVYLASPYSDPDPQVRQRRHDAVFAAVCRLRTPKTIIFSPIVASHPYALAEGPGSWETWKVEDRHGVLARDELWVYGLPGFSSSKGVNAEIVIAREAGKPVRHVEPTIKEREIWRGDAASEEPVDDLIHYESGASRSADAEGARYDLIPPLALRRLAERYAMGAKTHGDRNWEAGFPEGVVMNHLLTHIELYRAGDRSDDHLAAAAWGLFAEMHFEEIEKGEES